MLLLQLVFKKIAVEIRAWISNWMNNILLCYVMQFLNNALIWIMIKLTINNL